MSGFFSKLFGGKKKSTSDRTSSMDVVEELMSGLIEKGQFQLQFEVRSAESGADGEEEVMVELSGEDEHLLTEKEGAFLDALQLFMKRAIQHRLPEARINVSFDCNGFREESSKELIELADRLREKALEQGRSVYLRALAPKDRKIVHQHLAGDDRVRSRSVGDGLYKKIKIYPVKAASREKNAESAESATP